MKGAFACTVLAVLLAASGQDKDAAPPDDRCCAALSYASDAQFCADLQQAASQMKAQWIDDVTRGEGIDVSCTGKTIDYKRSVVLPSTAMKPGWNEDAGKKLDESTCKNDLLAEAMKNGWAVTGVFTYSDGDRYDYRIDCRRLSADPAGGPKAKE